MRSADCTGSSPGANPPKPSFLAFIARQFLEVLPPTLFFAVGFNVIVLTTQLILADYLIHFANFMLVTFSALVVGKAVLLANALPFFRRFDTAPIIQPILFKTLIYCLVVLIVRFIEKLVKYLLAGGTFARISGFLKNPFFLNRVFVFPHVG